MENQFENSEPIEIIHTPAITLTRHTYSPPSLVPLSTSKNTAGKYNHGAEATTSQGSASGPS